MSDYMPKCATCEHFERMVWHVKECDKLARELKQGEWILECDAEGEGDNLYRCSVCGQEYGCQEYDLPNYCGTCGARMKGVDDDTDNV